MCSFGSCQARFEFLSQFRKVRNAFECFVAQVQTQLPKTKRVWPMKINVICTVCHIWSCFLVIRFPGKALWIEQMYLNICRKGFVCKTPVLMSNL